MDVKEIQDEIRTTYLREQPARRALANPSTAPREAAPKGNGTTSTVLDEKTVREMADRINEFMRSMNYSLQFVPDRESGMVIIKILDAKGKVVRQIPPEELASISSMLDDNIGMILNERWG